MQAQDKDKVQDKESSFPPPYLLESCREIGLPTPGKWTLQGHSKAGERTGFWLSPIKVVLDAGVYPGPDWPMSSHVHHMCLTLPLLPVGLIIWLGVVTNRTPNAIFLTHSHVDHSWNLPWIYGCRTPLVKGFEVLNGRPVFAPKSAWPMITQLEEVATYFSAIYSSKACHNLSVGKMDDGIDIMKEQRVAPFMVSAGDSLDEIPGLKGLQVEVLTCYHPAESVAYGFSTVVMKLKLEYQGLSGKEIGELKRRSMTPALSSVSLPLEVEVSEPKKEPQLIFFGDTNIDSFEKHEEWKKYPVIVVECTQYPNLGKSADVTKAIGHMHWETLFPLIKSYPSIFWVLIHSSQAINDTALAAFEKQIKETENVTNFRIWVD